VSEVAVTGIGWPVEVVAQLPGGHDPKRANGRERPRFRTAESILAGAGIVDDFPLAPPRQIDAAHEHVPGIAVAILWVAIPIYPAGVITVARVALGLLVAIISGAAAELARVIVAVAVSSVAVAWIVQVVVVPMISAIAEVTLSPRLVPFVIIAIAVRSTIMVAKVVVPVSRVVAPSRVVKHRHLR
jgi:hypothetical protein